MTIIGRGARSITSAWQAASRCSKLLVVMVLIGLLAGIVALLAGIVGLLAAGIVARRARYFAQGRQVAGQGRARADRRARQGARSVPARRWALSDERGGAAGARRAAERRAELGRTLPQEGRARRPVGPALRLPAARHARRRLRPVLVRQRWPSRRQRRRRRHHKL